MSRIIHFVSVWKGPLIAALILCAPVPATPAPSGTRSYAGRPLVEALQRLQDEGLRLVFSSSLVPDTLIVTREPEAGAPRRRLEELLAPHGLAAQDGPGGTIAIVRAAPEPSATEPNAAPPPAAREEPARFEDAVQVEAPTSSRDALTKPLAVRPTDVMAIAGAVENVFRAIQLLPGVAGLNELEGRVAVRGGGPDQNLTVMDGIEVHNPYRLFGLASAFNPDTVEKFELVTGAFHPRYGDRLSSILVVDTRSGRRDDPFAGTAALSLTDANAIFEGRLPGPGSGSWLLTGRRTYYDLVLGRLTQDADLPSFSDLQLKTSWDLGAGRRLSMLALRNREGSLLARDDEDEYRTTARNELVSFRLDAPLGARAVTQTVASWYQNDDTMGFVDETRPTTDPSPSSDSEWIQILLARDVRVRDLSLRHETGYQASSRHLVSAGFDVHSIQTGLAFRLDAGRNGGLMVQSPWMRPDGRGSLADAKVPRRFRGGLWAHDRFTVSPRLTLEAGLRVDRGGVDPDTTLSPRVSARWHLDRDTQIGLAFGVHTQSTGFEKFLQRDYFFDAASMFDLSARDAPPLRSERAQHVVASAERNLGRGLSVRLEGYYKRFDDLVVGRLENDDEYRARLAQYDFPAELQDQLPRERRVTRVPTNDGRGRALGLELLLAHRPTSPDARFSGWLSYGLGSAEREAHGHRYPFDYDRRHALSVVGAYRFGAGFELSATARLASGFPWTAPTRLRVASREDVNDIDGDGNRAERVPLQYGSIAAGAYAIPFGYEMAFEGIENRNRARGPAYSRLDLRASFHPRWWGGRWTVYVDVINVLGARNFSIPNWEWSGDPKRGDVQFHPDRDERTGLPRIPSIGVRVRF